jgi:hypothetical protein
MRPSRRSSILRALFGGGMSSITSITTFLDRRTGFVPESFEGGRRGVGNETSLSPPGLNKS